MVVARQDDELRLATLLSALDPETPQDGSLYSTQCLLNAPRSQGRYHLNQLACDWKPGPWKHRELNHLVYLLANRLLGKDCLR